MVKGIGRRIAGFLRTKSRAEIHAARHDPLIPEGFTAMGQFAEDDIFIVGYPKSGNTWVQSLLAGVVFGLDLELAPDSFVQDVVPDVHWKEFYKRYSEPTFFKSHALPTRDYRRVVYLARDGRDAMVSYFRHLRAVQRKEIDFLELVRSGKGLFPCKWHEHVQRWLANPFKADLIVVRYEDLHENPIKELKRICHFAGLQRALPVLEMAARKASFAAMQERERRFGWDNRRWPKDEPFIRRGAIGSFSDEMPLDVQEAFWQQASAAMSQLDYVPVTQ